MLSKQKIKKFTFSSESFHQCHYTDHSHDQHIDKLPNCKTNIPNTATITYWNVTTVIIPSIAELLLLYLRCTTQPCFNHQHPLGFNLLQHLNQPDKVEMFWWNWIFFFFFFLWVKSLTKPIAMVPWVSG